jgi:hypothetical protein
VQLARIPAHPSSEITPWLHRNSRFPFSFL